MEPVKIPITRRKIEADPNPSESLYIRNIPQVREKLMKLRENYKEEFTIISDFDSTLTRRFLDNEGKIKNNNSWGIIEESPLLSAEFKVNILKRLNHYLALTNDLTKPFEERKIIMQEWFDADEKALIDQKMSKEKFRKCLECSTLYLRNGICDLLLALNKYNAKTYITSAGIKILIQEAFKMLINENPKLKNFNEELLIICATEEQYDSNDVLIKFIEPIVNMFNKEEILNEERYPHLKSCKGALILGDAVEDLHVLKKINVQNYLTIGFDNFAEKSLADSMAENYDIIIKGDGNMNVITELIEFIRNPAYVLQNDLIKKIFD